MILRISHYFCVFVVCLLIRSESLAADDVIGTDVMVVVVSRTNPVQTLSKAQVEDIFLGKTGVFPDGQRAVPLDLAEGSETRERFYAEVVGRTAAQIRSHWSRLVFTGRGKPPRSVGSVDEVLQAIATDPRIIGYIDRRSVTDDVKVVLN